MATVSQSPEAVSGPPVTQPVAAPLTASAVILVLTIDKDGEPVVHDLPADLSGLARTRPDSPGLARTRPDGTIVEPDGTQRQILRENMPFGSLRAREFGTYFIGYAATPSVTDLMLRRMFLGEPPGNYDRILDFSTAVTGTLFFVPTSDFLDDPPPLPSDPGGSVS